METHAFCRHRPVLTTDTTEELHAATGADTLTNNVPKNMDIWAQAVTHPALWTDAASSA